MLSIPISTVVTQTVRHNLVGLERDEAMYFYFDIGLSHYIDSQSFDERRGLHLLYHCPFSYSYITVFSAVTDEPFTKIKDVTNWKHECTHDSGWRDIRVFSDVYFEMARLINEALLQAGKKKVAPMIMHEHNTFGLFNRELFTWVPVRITKDPSDKTNYRRTLEIL